MNSLVEKEWEHAGLKCMAVLNTEGESQWRCGYVALPRGHHYWGTTFEGLNMLDVHGGVTFTSKGITNSERVAIKLGGAEPPPWYDKSLWWVGFDCAHAGDEFHTDEIRKALSEDAIPPEHKWTLDEVVKETNGLAEQLAKIK